MPINQGKMSVPGHSPHTVMGTGTAITGPQVPLLPFQDILSKLPLFLYSMHSDSKPWYDHLHKAQCLSSKKWQLHGHFILQHVGYASFENSTKYMEGI